MTTHGLASAWLAVSEGVAAWTAPFLGALERWGYAGVALGVFLESAGIPVPGETALVAAAFGAAHGVLSLPWIIGVAVVAGVLGDNLGFALGRRLGRGWAERHGHRVLLTPARLQRADMFFARFGPAAVMLARFVVGVRVVAAFAAGTSRMSWSVFLRYNVLGAVLWATLVSLTGYALGRGYAGGAAAGGRAGAALAVAIPVTLLAALLLTWYRRRVAARRATADFQGPGQAALVTRPGAMWTRARRAAPVVAELRAWASHLALRWLTALSVSAAAVLTFAMLTEEVLEHDTTSFDGAVRAFVLGIRTPGLHVFFTVLTWAGSSLLLGPIGLAAALWLWRRAGRRAAAVAALAPPSAVVLILALKTLFHRGRPEGAMRYAHLGYSYPSGHSTASMAIALTIAYVFVRQGMAPRWVIAGAVLFSLLVGMSRLYLDVHWATDVAGGWAVGLAVAAACAVLYERLVARARTPFSG